MVSWIVVYFLFVVVLLAVALLPTVRTALLHCGHHLLIVSERRVDEWSKLTRRSLQNTSTVMLSVTRSSAISLARRKWLVAGAGLLVVGPPIIAVSLRRRNILQFDEDNREINEQIAALLRGEQLALPAALPPAVFVTDAVVSVRPNLLDASRDWSLLDGEFRQRLLLVFQLMKQRYGYEMALLEGYRSAARQTQRSNGSWIR